MSPYYRFFSTAAMVAAFSACGSNVDPSHLTPVAAPAKRAATHFQDVYFFRGGSADGSAPDGIVSAPDGTLLGTTLDGGHIHPRDCKESGCGTIFQFDSLERPLYLFQPQPDAFHPLGTLLEHNGVYYGAAEGGAHGFGAIFSLSRNPSGNWVETTLYSFGGAPDGAQALGVVYVDARGNVFGTTRMGGTGTGCLFTNTGCGTFFELEPPSQSGGTWRESILHSFQGDPDGASPGAYAVREGGSFYGTTDAGGTPGQCPNSGGCGTIYKLTPSGKSADEKVVYSFYPTPSSNDGALPSTIIDGGDGRLYGTTLYGGGSTSCSLEPHVNGCGTMYVLTLHGAKSREKVLYAFAGGNDGIRPEALVGSAESGFYGTTQYGGSGGCRGTVGCGTIFGIARSGSAWNETQLHAFEDVDGRNPTGPVVFYGSKLIGVAQYGGERPCTCGALFEIDF